MARSLTVKHEESPSALFATFLILCGGFLLLGAAVGASADSSELEQVQSIDAASR